MPLIDAEYNFDYYQWNTLCSEADSYGSPIEYTIIGFKTNTVMAGPFTSTRWHQRSPYNFDCSGQVVGCVPVAMAQMMRFFGKPSKVNSMPYIQMVSQQTALTQFLKEVGNSVGIVYTDPNGSSGAYMDGTLSSYRSYGYTANAVYHNLATVKQWLMNEKKPIHMTGYLYGGPGHAWICDGMLQYGDSMSFFLEYIRPGDTSYYSSYSSYTPDYPGSFPGTYIGDVYLRMVWGWHDDYGGWYLENNVNTSRGDL